MKRTICTIFLCLLLCGATALADTPLPPMQYSIPVENGRIFLMNPDSSAAMPSGLYDADNRAIYMLDGYFYQTEILLSADGLSFVNIPWAQSDNGEALAFYESGKKIASYNVLDLLTDPAKGDKTASHIFWEDTGARLYDAETNELHITANCGTQYTFSLPSGELVRTIPAP